VHLKDDSTSGTIPGNFLSGKGEGKPNKSTPEGAAEEKAHKNGGKKSVKKGSVYKLDDSPGDGAKHSRKGEHKGKAGHKEQVGMREGSEKATSKRRSKKGTPSEHVAKTKRSGPAAKVRRIRATPATKGCEVCALATISRGRILMVV